MATDDLLKEKQLLRARNENSRLTKINKELLTIDNKHDIFIEEIKSIIAADKKFVPKNRVTIQKPTKGHTETFAAALSDLHLSELVLPKDSNYINEYNTVMAANGLWEYKQAIVEVYNLHKKAYSFDEVWVLLLGDLISGTIHWEQLVTNELTDPAAVVLASRLLAMFFRDLQKDLRVKITADCVQGNHPRMTAKMPTKKQAHTNLDWLIYEILKEDLKRDGIDITIHTSQIGMRKVYGHNYVFEHGIEVKSGREEEFEDRIRSMFDDPVYRRATGYQGASFDQLVIGNMHKEKFLQRTVVNGAFVGQNELGQSWRLKPIKPTQLVWGISRSYARTWQYSLDVASRGNKPYNPYGDYADWFLRNN